MNGRRPGGSGSGQGPLIALEEGCRRGGRAGSRLRGGMAAGNGISQVQGAQSGDFPREPVRNCASKSFFSGRTSRSISVFSG